MKQDRAGYSWGVGEGGNNDQEAAIRVKVGRPLIDEDVVVVVMMV